MGTTTDKLIEMVQQSSVGFGSQKSTDKGQTKEKKTLGHHGMQVTTSSISPVELQSYRGPSSDIGLDSRPIVTA